MGYEFELKFAATPDILAQVQREYPADWQKITMETTYYDDPDRRLSALHYTLRRRLENGVSVCTLKTPMPDGGRGEWETKCDRIEDAIEELCKLGAPRELLLLTAKGVFPSCGAKFTRHAASIAHNGTLVELALDEGILFGGGRELPLCELEVELKAGEKQEAMAFAQALAIRCGLRPEPRSKVRRATDLAKAETF